MPALPIFRIGWNAILQTIFALERRTIMASTRQDRIRIFAYSLRATIVGLGLAIAFVFLDATTLVQAQTFSVLHSFTGGQDGANPSAGLTMDGTGNLYGTTYDGGNGYGTAFKLRYSGSTWI